MSTTEAPPANGGTPTGQALERQSPTDMVKAYQVSIAQVLPSHVKVETWIRIAQSALKKGKRLQDGRTELEVAAENNPAVFMATVLDAARLGLEPGTDEYYLTPREVKGRSQILGIVGYQGYIELMYRAGAVEAVVAECVYRKDDFAFRPGVDLIPQHEIDWDLDDRGDLRLVYAFARMKGGAVSKVIVLNKGDIARIKAKAQNPTGKYSPWTNQPASMWLKSAVRQLRKWVPTSAEFRRELLRAEREIAEERGLVDSAVQDLPMVDGLEDDVIDIDGLEDDVIDIDELEDDIVDADVVEDEPAPNGAGAPDPQGGDDGAGEGASAAAGPDAAAPDPGDDDFPTLPEPEVAVEPEPEPEVQEPEEPPAPGGAIGANDVARYARQVFKKDYDAAPNGQKTKVVERLRHAVTYAQSGGKTTSLSDLSGEDLVRVNQRLRDIAGGALKYRCEDDRVVFTSVGSGKETPVLWSQLETAGASA
jgi:recombination protein RecT